MPCRQRGELFAPAEKQHVIADEKRTNPLFDEGREDGIEVGFGAGILDMKLQPECERGVLHSSRLGLSIRETRVHEHADCHGLRYNLVQQLQSLRFQLAGDRRDAGRISARATEACDEAIPDRVATAGEIVAVAALAASAGPGPPVATITVT